MKRIKVLSGPPGVRPARIICWDLETAPNLVTAHQLFNERGLPTSSIVREKYIICGAWKVYGDSAVYSVAVDPRKPQDDRKVVHALYKVLSSADAVVAHYGDAFDMRMFNARAIFHGLAPLPPVTQIDTYKIAKSKFKFNSNRLDYLGAYLGLGRKRKTEGQLWDDCMAGNVKALDEMQRYNKQDVSLLERVFLRLYPYTRMRINLGALTPGATPHERCGHCGSADMKYMGTQLMRTRFHEFYQCGNCGAWRNGPAVKGAAKRGTRDTKDTARVGARSRRGSK